jgi:hypothetical protein
MAQMTEQKLRKYFALSLIFKKGIPGWEDLHNEMQRLIFDNGWAEKTAYDTARTFKYPGES